MLMFSKIFLAFFYIALDSLSFFVSSTGNIFFVAHTGCQISNDKCDGSSERPFGDLMTAFQILFENNSQKPEELTIMVMDSAPSCPKSLLETADNSTEIHREFFVDIDFTLRSYNDNGKSIINFCDNIALSLIIKGGNINIMNLDFQGSQEALKPLLIKYSLSGFFILKPGREISLNIFKCGFIGTFISLQSSISFPTFLAIENFLDTSINVVINIDTFIMKDAWYPQGIIRSNPPFYQKRTCKIDIFNMMLINYGIGAHITHWLDGIRMKKDSEEYSDFAFILNNTILYAKNFTVLNASRILLANKFNEISIENMQITLKDDVTTDIKNPPELINLIMLNNIKIFGLSILESTIYTYDDNLGAIKRDMPFLNKSFLPTFLLNFEKNQALFAFGTLNVGTFSQLFINNTNIIKRETYGVAVFGLELKNELNIKNFSVNSLVIKTESKLGFLSVFYLAAINNLSLQQGTLVELGIYGYSNFMFGLLLYGNKINATQLKFTTTYIKTKSNRAEVNSFLFKARVSTSFVFTSNTVDTKFSCLFLSYIVNNIVLNEIASADVMCLYGCLMTLFYRNTFIMTKIEFNQVISEFMSSLLMIVLENIVRGKYMKIENSRGNSGAIYLLQANDVVFEESQFKSNWGTGGFNIMINKDVAGNFALTYVNKLVLKKSSFILGNSDTYGGGLFTFTQNFIEVNECIFLSNDAPSGGAFQCKSLNTLSVYNSKFIDNHGAKGGVFFGDEKNVALFRNCTFESNQAESASVLFLNNSNVVEIEISLLQKNQGFVQGGIIILFGLNQTLKIRNVEFIDNQAPFRGCLIEFNEGNTMEIEKGMIDYGEIGNGNFLSLSTNNKLIASNLIVKNINNMMFFLKCSYKNSISFFYLTIENNIWQDSFFVSEISNRVIINNLKVSNITILVSSSGLVNADSKANIYLKNCAFYDITARGFIIFKAIKENIIILEEVVLTNIVILDSGTAYFLMSKNQLNMSNILYKDFSGYSNTVFLSQIGDNNNLMLSKINITGYFSIEQVWNFTCLIKISGYQNLIIFIDASTVSENPNLFKVETLVYLKDEGYSNEIRFTRSNIRLTNYFPFWILNPVEA